MLIAEETFGSMEIQQLVLCMIAKEKGDETDNYLGDFSVLDVNDMDAYKKEHIIGAEHYNKALISRERYETDVLKRAKKENLFLVIYGLGAANVTATLFQRGFKAIFLRGDIPNFRKLFPNGLLTDGTVNSIDTEVLTKRHQFLKDTRGGRGRLLYTPQGNRRAKSAESAQRQKRLSSAVGSRPPWRY
ncbi:unnamed protein product, partial [Mesorhabditis spiculigera]